MSEKCPDRAWRRKSGAQLLAAALVALFLGAPWLEGLAGCWDADCAETAAIPAPAPWAEAGTSPCACPGGCAEAPGRGCSQSDEPARESLVGQRRGGSRRGVAEAQTLALNSFVSPAPAPDAVPPPRPPGGAPPLETASAPLFIRHRSILR